MTTSVNRSTDKAAEVPVVQCFLNCLSDRPLWYLIISTSIHHKTYFGIRNAITTAQYTNRRSIYVTTVRLKVSKILPAAFISSFFVIFYRICRNLEVLANHGKPRGFEHKTREVVICGFLEKINSLLKG